MVKRFFWLCVLSYNPNCWPFLALPRSTFLSGVYMLIKMEVFKLSGRWHPQAWHGMELFFCEDCFEHILHSTIFKIILWFLFPNVWCPLKNESALWKMKVNITKKSESFRFKQQMNAEKQRSRGFSFWFFLVRLLWIHYFHSTNNFNMKHFKWSMRSLPAVAEIN